MLASLNEDIRGKIERITESPAEMIGLHNVYYGALCEK